jgi:hypothetical protein
VPGRPKSKVTKLVGLARRCAIGLDTARRDSHMFILLQEEEQLAKLRASMDLGPRPLQSTPATTGSADRRDEIEGGYGGQEDSEDRYATTSGEH